MSDQTLKPCPFCGGEAMMQDPHWREGNLRGEEPFCKSCGVKMPRHWPQRKASAVEAWNTRATPTPPADDVDDEMVTAVEQWLRDNPPLTNAALRAENAHQTDRIAALESEVVRLRGLVKRAEVFVPVGHYSWHYVARKALEPRA